MGTAAGDFTGTTDGCDDGTEVNTAVGYVEGATTNSCFSSSSSAQGILHIQILEL